MYVKAWKHEPLKPDWRGPYQVLLISDSSVKVPDQKGWIYHTRVKRAAVSQDPEGEEDQIDDVATAKVAANGGTGEKQSEEQPEDSWLAEPIENL